MSTQYDIFNKKIKVYLKPNINLDPYKSIVDINDPERPYLFGYLIKSINIVDGISKKIYPMSTELLFVDHKEINRFNSLTPEQKLQGVIQIPFANIISYEVLLNSIYQ